MFINFIGLLLLGFRMTENKQNEKQDTFTKLMKNLGILPQDATEEEIQKRRSLAHFFRSTKELKQIQEKEKGDDVLDHGYTKSPRTVLQSPRSVYLVKDSEKKIESKDLKEIKEESTNVDSPSDSKDSKSPTISRKSSENPRPVEKLEEPKSMLINKQNLTPKVDQIIQKRRSVGNENQIFQGRERSTSEIYLRDKTKRISRIDEIVDDENQDKVFVIFKEYDKILQKNLEEKDILTTSTLDTKETKDPILVTNIKNPNKPEFNNNLNTKSNQTYSEVIKKVSPFLF